ncbi:hypothetical protein [Gemmatimonas sp.]|uniref:hypothetical protein n=1 Tax=Gemmatimonas sp. TaxID=1962908 RepID=UPI003F726BF1
MAVITYLLLPESVRPLTRLSLSLHAFSIALVASELVLPHTTSRETPWWRIQTPLLIALISFFVGRVSDVLFRWELDWAGMWIFLGLMILIWAVLRPERPESSNELASAPQLLGSSGSCGPRTE